MWGSERQRDKFMLIFKEPGPRTGSKISGQSQQCWNCEWNDFDSMWKGKWWCTENSWIRAESSCLNFCFVVDVTHRPESMHNLTDTLNMSHQAQVSPETKGQGGILNWKVSRKEREIERKPYFSFYGFHKGKLSDCLCQSDRVFYEHLAGPRPGLYCWAVIAVAIVGLRREERPHAIERGGAQPRLPVRGSVLVE